ncbi:MAG: RNA-guided endonuclease TnpB family protein [Coleofasciculus sp. G3-WIS-01]|uniref:RNA-guided endonuclease InsQ/TnpB family protein n=1 Tax=Coleofasciculus sp. G3-WIS-01 TaxID=3069528 RepID=UPI003301C36F
MASQEFGVKPPKPAKGLRNLQKAFTNFWAGRAKYPNFLKLRNGGSAEFTRSAFKWKDKQLWLAKCHEPLPIRWSRTLPENCEPSTVTVKLDASGRWFVARIHAQIADARKDFFHKLTTRLVRENQTIVVEDLAVKNMIKNHKLAQAIADASWSELVRQLEYKCQWYGRILVKIDRWFPSSKRCGHCGHVVDKLPLDVREWDCPECGTHHDRDINAANNILAAGLAVIVCGANIRPDGHKSKGQLRKTPLASQRG